MKKHALMLSLLLALPGPAAAEIYRSVDAQGRVTYSQTPPPGRPADKVTPRVAPANPGEAEALQRQMDALDRERGEAAKKAAESEAKTAERNKACTEARARLLLLAQSPPNRLMSRDDQGNMVRWTPEKHDEQRRQAEELAASSCD